MSTRRLRVWIASACIAGGFGGLAAAASPPGAPVVVIPIHGTVDLGMAHMVERSVALANDEHAAAVVLDVNSLGGLVQAALQIKDALFSAREPVIAYVSHRAFSSAALISLSSNRILMAPGASIGSAEPHPDTRETVSALRAEFESTAQRNHRNVKLAAAMVDRSVDVPEYKPSGTFLTLNTQDAVQSHIADAVAPSLDAALAAQGLANAPQQTAGYTWAELIARFATDPVVSGLLLSLGMLGLLIEMQTMHGIAGAVGIGSLALFFGAHVYAGFSNGLVIVLAVVGILGILWELHVVPGHGLPGIVGAVCLLFAVLFAFGLQFFVVAVETLATAIVLTAIAFSLVVRAVPQNAWAQRLALSAVQGPDYVTSADFSGLRGRTGTAVSYLRPAGIAEIDGRRVDVLTQGEFIPQGTPIRVARVEGARVFVEVDR
ncbi:MAG: ATP-dependent Clp protease proteolytic subunit [Candidatus Eremiobacteraeota bacterium]|nr:ATP-dependent Clp protease proteolytic subunit [Candidatus Eremiobacteraeota bacterium]